MALQQQACFPARQMVPLAMDKRFEAQLCWLSRLQASTKQPCRYYMGETMNKFSLPSSRAATEVCARARWHWSMKKEHEIHTLCLYGPGRAVLQSSPYRSTAVLKTIGLSPWKYQVASRPSSPINQGKKVAYPPNHSGSNFFYHPLSARHCKPCGGQE